MLAAVTGKKRSKGIARPHSLGETWVKPKDYRTARHTSAKVLPVATVSS